MLSQLRGVLDELNASERRKDKLKVASANLTDLLHEVMALRLDCQSDDGGALELPDKIMVEFDERSVAQFVRSQVIVSDVIGVKAASE